MPFLDDIDQFFGYFQSTWAAVDRLAGPPDPNMVALIKYATYFGMLDSLARVVTPSGGNQQRFTNLLETCCCWPEAQFTAVRPLQKCIVKRIADPNESGNKAELKKLWKSLSKWFGNTRKIESAEITNSPDRPEAELLQKLGSSQRAEIEKFRYSRLVYKYRCTVVHEFQVPTSGFSQGAAAYYMGSLGSVDANGTFIRNERHDLVFPLALVKRLVECAIKCVKTHCGQNQINPYDRFDFEDRWMK